MGSLTRSVPAPPAPAPVVFTPPPAASPAPEVTPPPAPSAEEIETQNRTDNLLRRARGTIGTILTGFRGVLGLKETGATPRKNLLGE